MHVTFVQNSLPPIIRAGALMVLIGGGLASCGRVGDVTPVAANGDKLSAVEQKKIQSRLYGEGNRYTIGGGREGQPVLEQMEEKISPELVD